MGLPSWGPRRPSSSASFPPVLQALGLGWALTANRLDLPHPDFANPGPVGWAPGRQGGQSVTSSMSLSLSFFTCVLRTVVHTSLPAPAAMGMMQVKQGRVGNC